MHQELRLPLIVAGHFARHFARHFAGPFAILLATLLAPHALGARTIDVAAGCPITGLRQAAQIAQPGDTIVFREGTYPGGDYVDNLRGTARDWITVMAAPSKTVMLDGGGNAWHIVDPAYVRIIGFTIQGQTGNGINIDDGGSFDTPAHHLVIENCRWRALNATGNNDQLKLSGVDSFEVRDCIFQDGSPGGSSIDMVGCHFGRFVGNIFERAGSNCIQAKGASSSIIIERNRFDGGGQRALNIGGSTGRQFFRPQDALYEAAYIGVYSNIFTGAVAPIAFVGAINCEVVNNTIWLPEKWAIRILQETTDSGFAPCGFNAFRNNIVVIDNRAAVYTINVGPNTSDTTFTFTNNLWHNIDDASWDGPNLPVAESNGIVGGDPLLSSAPADMTPRSGSPAIGAGAPVAFPRSDYRQRPYLDPRSIGAIEGGTASSVDLESSDRSPRVDAGCLIADGADSLELVDAIGRVVARGSRWLDLAGSPPGRYFVVVTHDGRRTLHGVIVP